MIRAATAADIERTFDRHIKANTGLEISALDPDKFVTVEQEGFMLCALIYVNGLDAEVHIMCPRDSALKSRDLCLEIIDYLAAGGIKTIYTSSTGANRRADNLARKLGFKEIRAGVYALEV